VNEVPYAYLLCQVGYFYYFVDFRYNYFNSTYGNADAYVTVGTGEVVPNESLYMSIQGMNSGLPYERNAVVLYE